MSPKYDIYPPFPPLSNFQWGSSCNGLFCFHDRESNVFLWNPTTHESKILPQSQSFVEVSPGVTNRIISCGIWVDHKSQDYKVMRFIVVYFEDESGHLRDCNHEIELYSLKTDSWKKIACAEFDYCSRPCAFMNGVYYVNAYRKGESARVILSFDFSTETISSLPIPDIDDSQSYYLVDYNGLLGILVLRAFQTETFYEHWVMRNGSWGRVSIFHTCGVKRPLGFSRNGELLFLESLNDHELLVFDSATGKLKHLGGCGFGSTGILELVPFSESFVQLEGGSNLETRRKKKTDE